MVFGSRLSPVAMESGYEHGEDDRSDEQFEDSQHQQPNGWA